MEEDGVKAEVLTHFVQSLGLIREGKHSDLAESWLKTTMAAHLCRLVCVCVVWSLIITLAVLYNALSAEAICQTREADVPRMFATKTSYDYVRGRDVREETVPGKVACSI